MITALRGQFVELSDNSVTLNVGGVHYEVFIPGSVIKALQTKTAGEEIRLVIYHYVQTDPSRSIPVLIGFNNKVEREFFEKFITVSGVGPKAALKALSVPIPQIAEAIDASDRTFLKTLPGVGDQRAREIIAKLQGKVGRFCLIQDGTAQVARVPKCDFRDEAMEVLLQLQYRKEEARRMVDRALGEDPKLKSVEELLNVVYRQKAVAPVE